MSNQQLESELLTRLSELESTLMKRLSRLEENLEETRMLVSDLYRYGRLKDLLAAGQWQEADQETTKVILDLVGHRSQKTLTPKELLTFPCNAIRVIDQLWKKYSGDRFGFSVQLQLYQSLGGNLDTLREQKIEFLERLGDRVGCRENKRWIEYEELNFSLEAPVGCFPANWWDCSPYGAKMINYFFMRLISCNM